jgi:peptidoglycan hydrolase-like protein with peptidoglycan-binding domain
VKDKAETTAEGSQEGQGKQNEVAQAQRLLTDLGFDAGPVDGRMGEKTRSAIRDFQAQEGINVNGRLNAGLLAQLELRSAGQKGNGGNESGVAVRVNSLVLKGKPVIHFVDDVVTPEVRVDTVFEEFQVKDLNTRNTDQATDLTIQAQINEFTGLQLKGWTKGIGLNADMDLDLQVKNLELATYSPYVVRMAGVYLNSGQLDTKVEGLAKRGVLQGEIQLDLAHMDFKPLDKEDAARIADQMGGVPLETAVSLLQDDDGRIDLTLPLSGTLNKPDVDISSAVTKAIGGVLKKVFPPTLALSMLSKIGKGGGASFEPVEFAPGSAELDDTSRQYLDSVVAFLNEHPKLSLKVCGRATALDRQQLVASAPSQTRQQTGATQTPEAHTESAQVETDSAPAGASPPDKKPAQTPQIDSAQLAETLEQLALERKNAVRSYMVKDKGIDAARVPECRSTYEAEDQGSPRVVISL